VYLFLKHGIFIPIFYVLKTIFGPFLIIGYRLFLLLNKDVKKVYSPSRNKMFFPLKSGFIIHLLIIIIALLVVTNNLSAKEIKIEEFGQKTILSNLVQNQEEQDVVETAEGIVKKTNYLDDTGVLKSQNILEEEETAEAVISTTEQGTALLNPNVPTTETAGQPREKIETYEVAGGDTISTIAAKFGISSASILWANNLSETSYIRPGDKLLIPPVSGVVYKVAKGDTIQKIAEKYKGDINNILEFNSLADASAIEEGQLIVIPGGVMPETPKPTPSPSKTQYAQGYQGNIPASAKISGGNFQWPTPSHKINQYFKWRHTGIDIDGTYSSPIYAAEAGTVEFTGSGSGYGNHIIINHGNGKKTLYGHLSKIYVKNGQRVERGQTIGMMGCTGWCTGTHLHFEAIIGGRKVNPLSYL